MHASRDTGRSAHEHYDGFPRTGLWFVKNSLSGGLPHPRPWQEGHEQRRFRQVILADQLGYGC